MYMSDVRFQLKTAREEIELILSDKGEFKIVSQYLEPLITGAIRSKKFGFTEDIKKHLHGEIISDIPIAIERFTSSKNSNKEGIRFSAYFTWYIGERINAELKKRSVWEKIRAALRGS